MDNSTAVILVAATLVLAPIAGHFNRYKKEDWKALRDELKAGLKEFKQWARRDGSIRVALLSGGSLVIGISWALS